MTEKDPTKCGMPDAVVLAVWPWRQRAQTAAGAAARFSAGTVVVQTVVAAVVAFAFFRKNHCVMAGSVAVVAGALALCSVVWPAGYHGVQRAFQLLGLWLGRILTYILLAPCFILVFGVAHMVMFLSRRDPLGNGFARERTTYWETHAPVADPARHMGVPY